MSEAETGLTRWLLRLLPRRTAERCFLPTYYELLAEHLTGQARKGWWARAIRAITFRLHIVAAAGECVTLALGDWSRAQKAVLLHRTPRGVDPMLIQDLRFAVRMLRKNPGFTTVAALALSLGIGANSAIFTVVHAVLLRPLPYADPATILELHETVRGRLTTISPPNLLDWKAQNVAFSGIAGYNDTTATLTDGSEPEQLDVALVGAELFGILGVSPVAGRSFAPDDERLEGPRVVMLGYAIWQRRFGADPKMVGKMLTLAGRSFEVIGIMPRGFSFPGEIDVWFPLRLTEEELRSNQRGAHYLNAVGRLKEGVTIQQAIDDLNRIEQAIAARHESVEGYGVWAQPLLDSIVGGFRKPLLLLLGAVAFVLLIACANVSNLLLARASARRVEIAVRSALGAGRWRIVRQLLAESLVLALVGGVCGVLFAAWGVRAMDAMLPQDLPRAAGIGVNLSVLLFTVIMTLITGVMFGVFPSIQASTPDVVSFLKDARRDGSASGGHRARTILIVAEVALSLILLTGAGLAIRSFDRLSAVHPGFDSEGVLAVNISIPEARYPNPAAVAQFVEQYVTALSGQPGVVAAGGVMMPPLARSGFAGTFTIVGTEHRDDQNMQIRAATPGYLDTLRIPLRRGRFFTHADRAGGLPVVVISEEAARRFWSGKDPIGQRVRLHVGISGKEPVREVVGVVGDVKLRTLEAGPAAAAYVPHGQYVADFMTIFVRTNGDPLAAVPIAKTQLAALDREIPLTRVRPATQLTASAVAQPRFRMVLLGVFALVALALAAVGLYGVMAFSVSQRQGEIGVRMALGADRNAVLRMVLRQGMAPVAVGIAIGLLGAAALTRVLSGLLYEVSALDPATYVAVGAILGLVAAIACYVPARRATRIDPLAALRAG